MECRKLYILQLLDYAWTDYKRAVGLIILGGMTVINKNVISATLYILVVPH